MKASLQFKLKTIIVTNIQMFLIFLRFVDSNSEIDYAIFVLSMYDER